MFNPENPMVLALTEIPEGPVKEAVVKERERTKRSKVQNQHLGIQIWKVRVQRN